MYEDRESPERRFLNRRLTVLVLVVAMVFLVLALRLYYLQVVRGPYFRKLSEENRISQVRVKAPRGIIYDRNGNVLVTNRPSFSVYVVLENVRDLAGTVAMLGEVLQIPAAEVEEKVRRAIPYRKFEPLRVREDVGREVVAALEARKFEWPGVQIGIEPRRSYPFGKLASHLLGQVGEISTAELKGPAGEGYRIGDHIGKKGIEKILDGSLKGTDGIQQVEVDSLGREIRVLASREPVPGEDVSLTLELALQQIVEEALGERTGAVVVMDTGSGEILAAASSPALDTNRFVRGLSHDEWSAVESDARHPLQNRVLQAQYPPGSVFKIVTAAAALDEGIIDENTSFYCRGFLTFGKRQYRCWKRGGHGEVRLHRALVESCDVFFYHLGIKTGIDLIADYAARLGLGRATGLALGAEAAGLVPSRSWKRSDRGEPWYPGETLSAAIGQGYNLVTPMQMAVLASLLANGGTLYRPLLIRSVTASEGGEEGEVASPEGTPVRVSARTLGLIREALVGVVNEKRGTGRAAAVEGLEVAGKTGTAQVVRLPRGSEEAAAGEVPLALRDHAWFVCYAPGRAGQVAVAVLVEHGGHGGSASAPLAGKILRQMKNLGYFQLPAGGEAAGMEVPGVKAD